jgi:hypothetical protein
MSLVRPREDSPDAGAKRQKTSLISLEEEDASNTLPPTTDETRLPGSNLPQSSYIYANADGQLGKLDGGDGVYHLREEDVGISGYLTKGAGKVDGIIKQR